MKEAKFYGFRSFKYLKKELGEFFGGKIKWNFTNFLGDTNDNPVKRFSPFTKPEAAASPCSWRRSCSRWV